MKLSKAIYLAIKNAILYDDASFIYDSFIKGKFNGDPDYATNINNVFAGFNQALSRLSDLERLPYRVDEVTLENNSFNISALQHNLKEIIAIAYVNESEIMPLPFSVEGSLVRINLPLRNGIKVKVEYKEDIFFIQGESYYYNYTKNEIGEYTLINSKDEELKDYGITDQMVNAICEYVKGFLDEPVAAELANMHITRAEQYFLNINPVRSAFAQTVVYKKYGIE